MLSEPGLLLLFQLNRSGPFDLTGKGCWVVLITYTGKQDLRSLSCLLKKAKGGSVCRPHPQHHKITKPNKKPTFPACVLFICSLILFIHHQF